MVTSLRQLESGPRGGLTGSRLVALTVRGGEGVIECTFEWPGDDGTTPARTACLRLAGVAWFDFEPRDPKATRHEPAMQVTSDPLDDAGLEALGFPPAPAGTFAHRLHANGTDGALCLAAESAELEWSTPGE